MYSKELCLGNQPLETERWIWPQFLGNWLAGPSVSKIHTGRWKLSAGFDSSFLETGWLAQRGRFPTLGSLLYGLRLRLPPGDEKKRCSIKVYNIEAHTYTQSHAHTRLLLACVLTLRISNGESRTLDSTFLPKLYEDLPKENMLVMLFVRSPTTVANPGESGSGSLADFLNGSCRP